jgi:beta-lactamase class A
VLGTALVALAFSTPNLPALKMDLDAICRPFHGRIGYSVLDLTSGRRVENRPEELFPTASTIKTAIALEALREVDAGTLHWNDVKVVPDESGREASMWSYFFKDGTKVDLDGYVNLMLTVSDNTATIVLRRWLTPEAINATTKSLGCPNTKVLWDHFPDTDREDQALREKWGLGVTTPGEMNRLWELIYRHKAGSPAVCEKLMRILSHQYWDEATGVSVPVGIETCIKNGAVNQSRSECAIVFSDRPYILTIYTAEQQDQRWTSENEGEVTILAMCRKIWSAFEPKRPYQAPAGYEKFLPTGGGG